MISLSRFGEVFLFSFFGLFLSFLIVFQSDAFYHAQFEKNGADDRFGQERVDETINDLRAYLTGKGDELNTTFFNTKERQHLADVRSLVRGGIVLLAILAILALILLAATHDLNAMLRTSAKGMLILAGLLIVVMLTFSASFLLFHKVAFTNDLWQLNPTDSLILLFPESFFRAFVLFWIGTLTTLGVLLLSISKSTRKV